MHDLLQLQGEILHSYRALPWVQVWVAWLVGVNAVGFGQRQHEAGRLISLAFDIVEAIDVARSPREIRVRA